MNFKNVKDVNFEEVRPKRPKQKIPYKKIVLVVLVLILLTGVNSFFYIVAEDELAVVKVFNETKEVIVGKNDEIANKINDLDPLFKNVKIKNKKGLSFKIPFITTVDKYSSKLLTYVSNTGQVTTNDKVKFEVRLFAEWQITHPGLFETNYGSILNTSSKIDETLYANIISIINNLSSDAFLTDKDVLYKALEAKRVAYNKKIQDTGIYIHDLEIYRVGIPTSNFNSVYNKMNAERNAVAAGFKADGQKIYAETISNVDLEAATIEAKAIEEAARIKGNADAEAVKIYADAFSKDPEFYEFWRTIKSYEKTIDSNSTLYLDKNNPYLKYFSNMENN